MGGLGSGVCVGAGPVVTGQWRWGSRGLMLGQVVRAGPATSGANSPPTPRSSFPTQCLCPSQPGHQGLGDWSMAQTGLINPATCHPVVLPQPSPVPPWGWCLLPQVTVLTKPPRNRLPLRASSHHSLGGGTQLVTSEGVCYADPHGPAPGSPYLVTPHWPLSERSWVDTGGGGFGRGPQTSGTCGAHGGRLRAWGGRAPLFRAGLCPKALGVLVLKGRLTQS